MTYSAGGRQHIAVILPNPPRVQAFVLDGAPVPAGPPAAGGTGSPATPADTPPALR
jgi:hypothetical protein